MRYLYALAGILLLLAATGSAETYVAEMDVDTFVNANEAEESFSDSDLLWVSSNDDNNRDNDDARVDDNNRDDATERDDDTGRDDDAGRDNNDNGNSINITYIGYVNLFGAQGIFDPDDIESATLSLEVAQVEEEGEVIAYFMEGATLDTLAWDDRVEYLNNVSSESVDIDEEDEGDRIELDVTPIIKKAVEVCTEGCPYTIVLVAEDNTSVAFVSSEASEEDMAVLEYVTEE